MLFVLTGAVKTGKTRWLERVVAELARDGVACFGVLAPGIWHPLDTSAHQQIKETAPDDQLFLGENSNYVSMAQGEGGFEKLGIDNVLLPEGERFRFALRRDIAQTKGLFDATSQSEAVQLGWHIDDAAIERVNAHFARAFVAEPICTAESTPSVAAGSATDRPFVTHAPSLLVIDELGRLELLEGCGLTAAMALLECGPSALFPHALVVVRDWLADTAEDLFAAVWGGATRLAPGEDARVCIREAFGLEKNMLPVDCNSSSI